MGIKQQYVNGEISAYAVLDALDAANERIAQLEQELEAAKESLTVAYMSGAAEAKKERDALKAHCEGYHHLCQSLYMSVHVSEIKSLSAPVRDLWLAGQADFAAKERGDLPDFRLKEIQAQAIEPVLLDKYEYFDEHGKYTVVDVEDIKCRIQQLREDT